MNPHFNILPTLGGYSNLLARLGGFCSMHSPDIVSACGVWFTFVFRNTYTPCGRVMGLKVLPTLVGLSLWDCLALAFCTLIVSYFKGFVKNFFEEFLFHLCRLGICCSSSLTPLLYHNLGDLSRGILHFFSSEGGANSLYSSPLPLDTTDYSTSTHGFQ